MSKKSIQTVAELISELRKYPADTEISHMSCNKENSKTISDLIIVETHPIGDRDTEEILLLAFSCNPNSYA